MRIAIVVIVCLAGLAAAAFAFLRGTEVQVIAPKRGTAAEIVYANGVVEPRTWAKIASLVRARIVEECNCEGKTVAKGDVLARLDAGEARAQLEQLKARVDLARKELDRTIDLLSRRVVSRQAQDQATNRLLEAEALAAAQRTRIENYVIRAPVSGTVLRQDGEVGEVAEPGNVLFWVGLPRPLIVVADINEEDIPAIAVDQRALVKADAFPGQSLEATVSSITPKGDPVAKTYRVRLALPDDTPLFIGMTVEVNVVVRTVENALLIPRTALSGASVFVVDDADRVRRREIEMGIRGIEMIEVLQGLEEGDRVVAPVPDGLADGARVSVGQSDASG